jgi:hypothetical protein
MEGLFVCTYTDEYTGMFVLSKEPLCLLCGKTSIDGNNHKKCEDREAFLADVNFKIRDKDG